MDPRQTDVYPNIASDRPLETPVEHHRKLLGPQQPARRPELGACPWNEQLVGLTNASAGPCPLQWSAGSLMGVML